MAQTRYLIQVFLDDDFVDGNTIWTEEDVQELFIAFEEVLGGNYELTEEWVEGEDIYNFILTARPSCANHIWEERMIEIFPKPDSKWSDRVVEIRFINLSA